MRRLVTVVGDTLLDRDVVGSVSRVCPDGPAPVLDVATETTRPGGAGLAASLLAADGHPVRLVTAIGDDEAGRRLRRLLAERGVDLVALPTTGATRQKTRVRAAGQSLVRVDSGTACPPAAADRAAVEAALDGAGAVLVSDYAGEVLDDATVRAALGAAADDVPLVWDPHPRGGSPVPGARLVTPNQSEAASLSGDGSGATGLAAVTRHAVALREIWQAHAVAVTLGPRGALLTLGTGAPEVVPAPAVGDGDTCGAGDRFASTAAAALASGAMVSAAVEAAVASASAFVRAGGAAGLTAGPRRPEEATAHGWERVAQVRARGGTVVATGGCFDLLHAGHVGLLRAARALGDCLVVCINSDDSVRRLKGPGRPLVPQTDRARVLEALEHVDAVRVFDEDTPAAALRDLRPDVWVKGGDYALTDLPEADDVSRWGGQCVVLPYLSGRSTTTLIDAARGRAVPKES